MGDMDRGFRDSVAALMQRHSDRLWQPACDIYRTSEGWVVKFDLAGIDPDEVSVTIVDHKLVVRGTRRDHMLREGVSHYHMEITYSRFERRLSLPCNLESAEVRTEYHNGLLLVTFVTQKDATEECDERNETKE